MDAKGNGGSRVGQLDDLPPSPSRHPHWTRAVWTARSDGRIAVGAQVDGGRVLEDN